MHARTTLVQAGGSPATLREAPARRRSAQDGTDDRGRTGAEEEDARQAGGLESVAGVVLQLAVLDRERAGAVVADEEDRPAALGGVIVGQVVAVIVSLKRLPSL